MFNIVNLGTVISLALSSQLIARNETLLKWETFWGEGRRKKTIICSERWSNAMDNKGRWSPSFDMGLK